MHIKTNHKIIGYAEDIAVLGRNQEAWRDPIPLLREAEKISLQLNENKTKYMIVN